MKKIPFIIISFALAAMFPAFADPAPMLQVQSGTDIVDITLSSEGNGVWGINSPASYSLGNGASFTLDTVTLNSDPNVFYGIGVTNTATGDTPYTFTFVTPTNLSAGQYSVSSSLAGSLTNGGSSGVTLEPTTVGSSTVPVQQSFIGVNDAGVDLLTTSITNTPSPLSQPFGSFTANSTYNLTSSVTQISVTTSFDLSGDAAASLSGQFDVEAVPEPSSFALGVLCAGAFLMIVRRRVAVGGKYGR